MTAEKKEVIEVLLANRLYVYSLFHKVFGRDPSEELLQLLTSDATCEAFRLIGEEGDIMDKGAKFLGEVRADMAEPDFLGKVKGEYTLLFVGPIKLVAPPWESVYTGKEAMLFQESTLKVREYYKKYNMLPEGYPHVADDSLALEMAFMSKLAERCMDAMEKDDLAEVKSLIIGSDIFLEEHLLAWIPKFLERMADAATDYLYPQMCLILDTFLKKDHEILGEILHEM